MLNVEIPASFTSALIERSARSALVKQPEWRINGKLRGRVFAELLSLKVPKLIESNVAFQEIALRNGIVVKPSAGGGSFGVYVIRSPSNIYDVQRNVTLGGVERLMDAVSNQLERMKTDSWNVEEYVSDTDGNPPRDLKFYCFYGHCPLVSEVKRYPNTVYCWWDGSARAIDTGRFSDKRFRGDGFPDELLRCAEAVSLEVPAPFIRIDFLCGANGTYLGEFTPRPGGFFQFNERTDAALGRMFRDAEARLTADMLEGKRFELFKRAVAAPLPHQTVSGKELVQKHPDIAQVRS